MNNFVLFFSLLFFSTGLFAQQFSQYNTGTLYDAFENPAQKVFILDSSRTVAFNLFVPAFNSNFYLTGDAQAQLKSRAFLNRYDSIPLPVGQNRLNRVNANFNSYAFMLKVYNNPKGNQELGFFIQSRAEGKGLFSDESVQIIPDYTQFTQNSYTNVFNTKFYYQVYHQLGFSYRGDITRQFALGFKLSALLGVVYNKVDIDNSYINFDKPNDRAFLSLAGRYHASFEPGKFTKQDLIPSFKNPGAAISVGASYRTNDGYFMQWNVKDLGFIHWNKLSKVGHFDNTGVIEGLSTPEREDNVASAAATLVQNNSGSRGFTTPVNGKAEFSVARQYWLNYDRSIKYTPTLILSKELFYTTFTGALVNHVQYRNLVATVTTSYDDLKLFNFGAQLMIKSPNAEFYIGSERLLQTGRMLSAATSVTSPQITAANRFSGADFFMGFSIKMGRVVERPENASTMPMSERKTFIQRLKERISGHD